MNVFFGKLLLGFFTLPLLVVVPRARADATVVTDHVISTTHDAQTDVVTTFGQVFHRGDVPRGASLAATLDGKPVPLQSDVKATYTDGSLRHAVLTARIATLPGRARLALAIMPQAKAGASAQAPDITLAQLLATGYDARVALDVEGTRYTASARTALQDAASKGTCGPRSQTCMTWLSGPLAGEWVVSAPVTAADGTPHANLRAYFAVRAHAGNTAGAVSRIRTDIIMENTDAFAPQAQPRYTATLTSGTASYTSPPLTQYAYTRWHKVLWWNGRKPRLYLRQDTRYIQASRAISRYMKLVPDETFLAGLRQSCPPLDHCDQTRHMGNAGSQPAIGPLPQWTSVYIVDPDVRAYRWMLANTDALGAYSIHYRDAATGRPVSITRHPYVTIANWASAHRQAGRDTPKGARYKADLLPNCVNNAVVTKCTSAWYGTGNPNRWDNAHQPAQAFVAYMVTGDYYYMSELAFDASMNQLWSNEGYRDHARGLIDRGHSQVRGKAWVLREMADAAWLLPDHHPLKNEFTASVENSLADWNRKYTDNPSASPLRVVDDGVIYSVGGGKRNAVAPWQHSFFTWSVGHAAELGFKGAAAFRDWLAGFEIALMTDWQSHPERGYCWLEASAYKVQVQDADGQWLPSFTAAYAATFPSLAGLECNSPAMLASMEKLEGKSWQAGKMAGYPTSPTGFPANVQIGIATAADSGLPRGLEAWRLFHGRSVKPEPPRGYNNFPNFALLPRSAPSE